MKRQPEALRLAKLLDNEQVRTVEVDVVHYQAAAELLRQHKEIELLRQQLARQGEKPEPVAWIRAEYLLKEGWNEIGFSEVSCEDTPLYRTPPQREWVGLTDEERKEIFESMPGGMEGFLRTWGWLPFSKALEQKLKEKNT